MFIYSFSPKQDGGCIYNFTTGPQGCDTHTMMQPWMVAAQAERMFCAFAYLICLEG